jgi:hypothetical protein
MLDGVFFFVYLLASAFSAAAWINVEAWAALSTNRSFSGFMAFKKGPDTTEGVTVAVADSVVLVLIQLG